MQVLGEQVTAPHPARDPRERSWERDIVTVMGKAWQEAADGGEDTGTRAQREERFWKF